MNTNILFKIHFILTTLFNLLGPSRVTYIIDFFIILGYLNLK